jgi:hypothetical protein
MVEFSGVSHPQHKALPYMPKKKHDFESNGRKQATLADSGCFVALNFRDLTPQVFFLYFFLLGFAFICSPEAYAVNSCISNVASGNWSAAGSWTGCGGNIPGTIGTDIVIIQNGHTITLNVDASISSITIQNGGTLTTSTNTLTLTLTSGTLFTLQPTGVFTPGSGTVVMNPDATVTLTSGTITMNNLSLTPTISTNDVYTFGGGTLTLNGDLIINPTKTSGGSKTFSVNAGAAISAAGLVSVFSTGGSVTSSILNMTASNFNITASRFTTSGAGQINAQRSTFTVTGSGLPNGSNQPLLNCNVNFGLAPPAFLIVQTTNSLLIGACGSSTWQGHDVTINSPNVTITGWFNTGTTVNIDTLTIVAGTLKDRGNQILGSSGGHLTIASGAGLEIGNADSPSAFPDFAPANISLDVTSTVSYIANFAQSISSTPTYGNLWIGNGGSGTKTSAGPITVGGHLTIDVSNTFNTSSNNYALTVGGNFFNSGTFTANSSTLTFNGSGSKTITSGGASFYSATFNGSGGAWVLQDSMTATGTLTLTNGALDLNGKNLTVSGPTFSNASELRLQGIENVSLAPTNAAGSTVTYNATSGTNLVYSTWTYKNLNINGSGGTFNPASAAGLTINENLTVVNGTLDTTGNNYSITASSSVYLTGGTLKLNASTMSVAGNWITTGATFTADTSTITFTATSAKTITSAGQNFNSLIFNGNGGAWTLQDPLKLKGDATFTAGTFNSNSKAITVAGNWVNAGVTSTLTIYSFTFNGSGAQKVLFRQNPSFAQLTSSNTSSGGVSFSSSFTATQIYVNTSGLGAGATLYFAGDSTFTATSLKINGTSSYPVVLLSTDSAGGKYWYVNNTSTNNVSYVQVSYSDASQGATIDDTTGGLDGGHNVHWTFPVVSGGPIASAQSGNWYDATTWTGGVVPTDISTATILNTYVVTATATVTVASITVNSGGTLRFDGAGQAVTFTIKNGGKLVNNGSVVVLSSANAVTLQGESGGSFIYEGTDIDYNAKKIYLGRVDYRSAVTLESGETIELVANSTFTAITANSGSHLIHGADNELSVVGNVALAPGTFTKGSGTSKFYLVGDGVLNSGNQNLGNVVIGR